MFQPGSGEGLLLRIDEYPQEEPRSIVFAVTRGPPPMSSLSITL